MYRVPQPGLTLPAVASRLERRVRHHRRVKSRSFIGSAWAVRFRCRTRGTSTVRPFSAYCPRDCKGGDDATDISDGSAIASDSDSLSCTHKGDDCNLTCNQHEAANSVEEILLPWCDRWRFKEGWR